MKRFLFSFVALMCALGASACDPNSPSGPICGGGGGKRVVIDSGETGDFRCIDENQNPPLGFKEFPGGSPKYNSDPRWREYSLKYFDHTRAPKG